MTERDKGLNELDDKALADALMRMARDVSSDDPVLRRADSLAKIRAAAAIASGHRLAILEVAEAFVRAACPVRMGKAELALRRFAAQGPEALDSLRKLAMGAPVWQADVGDAGRELVDVGVLQPSADGHGFKLRPSLVAAANEIAYPVAFHFWAKVEQAKTTIRTTPLTDAQAAAYLAGEFGTSVTQAKSFLPRLMNQSEPLAPRPTETAAAPANAVANTSEKKKLVQELLFAVEGGRQDRGVPAYLASRGTTARYGTQLSESPRKLQA